RQMCYSLLTVRRLRPFARRRLSTSRPFLVLIRTRNPCVFAPWRVFGWDVGFPFMHSLLTANRQCYRPFGRVSIEVVCATVCVLQIDLTDAPATCTFGLFPEFSNPVEKTVDIRGNRWRIYTESPFLGRNEPLGRDPVAYRNKGEQA